MGTFDTLEGPISFIIKTMIIVEFIVYALFALILISQIKNKRQVITTEHGPLLEFLAFLHFGLSIGLIILSFIIL